MPSVQNNAVMPIDHATVFHVQTWLRAHRKMFQSRLVLVMLLAINFANSTILSLDVFGPESIASLVVFVVNLSVVVLALFGIYHYKAVFLIPNVVTKVMLSSAALFYGLQLADTSDYSSVCHFVWLLLSLIFFIWEIQAMFTATFGIIKELNIAALSKPPPSYNQVVDDEVSPPSYSDAVRMLEGGQKKTTTAISVLDVASLEAAAPIHHV